MARKDQVKLFFCALLEDDPFVCMLKEAKMPLKGWAYVRAIRHWRDILSEKILGSLPNKDKQKRAAFNKALEVFKKIEKEEISIGFYINLLLCIGDDIFSKIRSKKEKYMMGKILENLLKLYYIFDPDLTGDRDMDDAIKTTKIVEEVF